MKKITTLLLITILVTTMLSACGSPALAPSAAPTSAPSGAPAGQTPAAKPVSITVGFAGDSGEDKALASALVGIETAVPGVTVEIAKYPTITEFWANLPGQIAAGTAPDILLTANEDHMSYIVEGLFMPLDGYGIDTANILPGAVDAWTYEGKLYAYPTSAAPGIFAVNMDMWKAAGLGALPKTWDEVYVAAKALTTADVKGICIDFSQGYHPTQYMNSFGGGWGNGATINSPENVMAMEYILKMYKEGLAINPKDIALSWDGEVFAAGKAAMTTAGAWYNSFMAESAPNTNFEIIAMPGGNGKHGSSLHSQAFAILNSSKNPELAAKVAVYMGREDAQKDMAIMAGYQPSSKALQDWYYTEYVDGPKMAGTRASLDTAVSFGYPVRTVEFTTDFVAAFDSINYAGATTTAKQMLDTLAEKYGTQG